MNSTNAYKMFFIWFSLAFPTVVVAILTQNKLAICSVWILLIMIGLIVVKDIVVDSYFSIKSKGWPKTRFSVKKADIIHSSGSSDSAEHYNVNLKLEYEVNKIKYELICHEFNIPFHQTKHEAEKYLQEITLGNRGENVYFNPSNPNIAYLKPGFKLRHALGLVVGLGIITVPFLTLIGVITWT